MWLESAECMYLYIYTYAYIYNQLRFQLGPLVAQ